MQISLPDYCSSGGSIPCSRIFCLSLAILSGSIAGLRARFRGWDLRQTEKFLRRSRWRFIGSRRGLRSRFACFSKRSLTCAAHGARIGFRQRPKPAHRLMSRNRRRASRVHARREEPDRERAHQQHEDLVPPPVVHRLGRLLEPADERDHHHHETRRGRGWCVKQPMRSAKPRAARRR